MIEFRKARYSIDGREDRVEIRHDSGSVMELRIEGRGNFAVMDNIWTVLPGEFRWAPDDNPILN